MGTGGLDATAVPADASTPVRTAARTAAGRLVTDPLNTAVRSRTEFRLEREGKIVLISGFSDEVEIHEDFSFWTLRPEGASEPHA